MYKKKEKRVNLGPLIKETPVVLEETFFENLKKEKYLDSQTQIDSHLLNLIKTEESKQSFPFISENQKCIDFQVFDMSNPSNDNFAPSLYKEGSTYTLIFSNVQVHPSLIIGHCGEVLNKEYHILKANTFYLFPSDFSKVSVLTFKNANKNVTLVQREERNLFIKRKTVFSGRWFVVANYQVCETENYTV